MRDKTRPSGTAGIAGVIFGILVPALALMVFSSRPALGQPELGSLYGSKNIQYVTLRYLPWLFPETGAGGEMSFGFNTLSAKTEYNEWGKYFYGVSLGGGGVSWLESEIGSLDERDGACGYVVLDFQGKLFDKDEGDARFYLGWSAGIGFGSYWVEQIDDDPEVPAGSLSLYRGGVEAGAHIRLSEKYWLVTSVGMDLTAYGLDSDNEVAYPAVVNIGLARWRGVID